MRIAPALVLAVALPVLFGCDKILSSLVDIKSEKVLSAVANEVNKTLPRMIDSETELYTTLGLEGVLVYKYRLVNRTADQIDKNQFIAALRPNIVNAACTTPETRDQFLKKGVTLRYSYADKVRTHIVELDVKPSDCKF